jgi:hypothetical protein
VGAVKMMARSLKVKPLGRYMQSLYNLPDRSLRENFRAYATDHDVSV